MNFIKRTVLISQRDIHCMYFSKQNEIVLRRRLYEKKHIKGLNEKYFFCMNFKLALLSFFFFFCLRSNGTLRTDSPDSSMALKSGNTPTHTPLPFFI